MINLEIYDRDFVNPKPKVFNGIAVMTPPKNASSYIQLYHGATKMDWTQTEYHSKLAIKRDPIDRWCGSINQQKSRMKWDVWSDNENDIAYWDRDPNDIVNDHMPEDSPIRQISEFCGQYEWAGEPITEYDDAFYVYEVSDMLPMLGLEDDNSPIGNKFKNRTSDKIDNPVTIGDLTPITKEKIMFIYQDDYQNGWK